MSELQDQSRVGLDEVLLDFVRIDRGPSDLERVEAKKKNPGVCGFPRAGSREREVV
jgi:hypothetical protein